MVSFHDFVRLDGILMTWSRASFVGLGWNVVGAVTISVWTGRKNQPQRMYTKRCSLFCTPFSSSPEFGNDTRYTT